MSAVKLVAVFGENKLGQIADVTRVLADAGINIRWVTIASSETFGVIKVLVDPYEVACQRLKESGFTVSLIEVLAVDVRDQPGGLHAVVDLLAKNRINVQNASGFVSHRRAVLLIEVAKVERAGAVLAAQGHRCLSQEEMMRL